MNQAFSIWLSLSNQEISFFCSKFPIHTHHL